MKKNLMTSLLVVLSAATTITARSQDLPLGTMLPMQDQTVSLVTGENVTVGSLTGTRGTVIIFWSNTCQWCNAYEARVNALYSTAAASDIALVLVNSNDPGAFPQEAAAVGASKNYRMPYIQDTGSRLAAQLSALRTPHVFVFDNTRRLVYTGGLDDAPGDPENVQQSYLADVIAQMANGGAPTVVPTKAFGCRIKFAAE